MTDEARERRRMLGRLKGYLARRRSPRAVLSAILFLTALAGFSASVIMLKTGLVAMWLRYPLAVVFGWGVFLLLVSLWAKREREEIRVEEELANLGPKDECFDTETAPGVFDELKPRLRWLDWLDIPDLEGCLVVLAVMALIPGLRTRSFLHRSGVAPLARAAVSFRERNCFSMVNRDR